jgi:hypothetical protein
MLATSKLRVTASCKSQTHARTASPRPRHLLGMSHVLDDNVAPENCGGRRKFGETEDIALLDFSHIGEELLEMGKQPLGALSKLLLLPAAIPEFIKDLADVLALAKKKNMKRREQAKLHALDEDQSDV